ncbi:monosaccharide ABC transporter substrate-binding protein, CUT2 family [Pseudarthrobacter phenanthrenivorans Sphe3]|uniref:Monosaccharide ABC transporter substrate-binding protein, CUT2 family n=1 Tax=Pseudarthrobacter phenanthrenivorans (strain DSM 18606 / JCM 16027 / LMG 23796 / Sphe3) TaxID=930171 RepID=F0M424_PSEPM|nr:substrate-binding domain-containing protein [Pseudarthrobacter phenanthrenivorans]ADX72247.1 monosaccharide ABC transporter substrate-binding protein, CUT2 family [Pseudarthrobacter phenanthrenivorans Sphe3]
MRKSVTAGALALATMASLLSGCASETGSASDGAENPLAQVKAADLVPENIVGLGPNGVKSGTLEDIKLTDDEVNQAKQKKFRVGIVMQTMNIEWSTEQVRGITEQLKKYDAEVVGVADPNFDVQKQVSSIENMIQLKPDAIISIPVDDTATAEAYRKIGAAGIKLIMMDNVPSGLEYPKDYQGMVSSDNQGNGAVCAEALAKYIPEGGTVGVLDFGVDFFVTKERMKGFVDWMKQNRPDIKIKVAEFLDPANSGKDAGNFLTANPDVQGMFTEWEVPAVGIDQALRAQGKTMPITAVNIASDVAADLASGGNIKALSAQVPYDQGLAEADMAVKVLLGGTAPNWLAFPAVPVLQNNVLDAWKQVYHQDPPSQLTEICTSTEGCS